MKSLHVYWLAWIGGADGKAVPCDCFGVCSLAGDNLAVSFSKGELLSALPTWMPEELNLPTPQWSIQTFTLELENE